MFETFFKTFVLDAASGRVKPVWYMWAGLSVFLGWIFFWWSIGALPTEAFGGGFAKAVEVQSIKTQMLQKSIIDYRVSQCAAPTVDGKTFYAGLLQEKLLEYSNTTKTNFPLPDCKDLVAPKL